MPKLSINQLSEITGRDRRTIKMRLDPLPFDPGPKRARLYDSVKALDAIYGKIDGDFSGVSYDEARRLNVLADTELKRVQTEEKQRTRIPIEIVNSAIDEVSQAIAAIIKSTKGKLMTEEEINMTFEQLRNIPKKLKW